MYDKKPYLQKYIEFLIQHLCQCPIYYKILSTEFKSDVFLLYFQLKKKYKFNKKEKTKGLFTILWRKLPMNEPGCDIYKTINTFEDCNINDLISFPYISTKLFTYGEFDKAYKAFIGFWKETEL